MPIFQINAGKLKKLGVLPIAKERMLQTLVESNLKEVLDLAFLATEYSTTFGGRIDTLAVDASGAPVLIEYKRNRNDNVINQSLSYLKWLKSQKPEFFEKLMLDKLGSDDLKGIKLDWSNPRVICIAETFSKFDIDTAEVVPLRIELMRYRYYENNIFSLEPVLLAENGIAVADVKTKGVFKEEGKNKDSFNVSLLEKTTPETKELYELFRERIMAIDDSIDEKPNSLYVAYRRAKNFAEVHINKSQLKIHLRPIDYIDPRNLVEKIPEGYNWTLDRRVYLKTVADLDYVFTLIEQSYKDIL